jgi:hypothetical protein
MLRRAVAIKDEPLSNKVVNGLQGFIELSAKCRFGDVLYGMIVLP